MAYPKLTPIVATGATEPRYIADRFADVVNVKDFGAKGDGITDDTEAIQATCDSAQYAEVVFPKGTYCISDTISIYGVGRGTKLSLGMSTIKWIGEEAVEDYSDNITDGMSDAVKYNINTYGWAWYAKPMIHVKWPSNGASSRAIIEGGVIDGQCKASMCIKNSSHGTLIHGTRIQNGKHCGVCLATDDPSWERAGVATLSDCYIVGITNYGVYGGSATRLNRGLSNDIGVFVHSPDNKIDNCIIDFWGCGICLRSSGNQICNTHITIEFPDKLNQDDNTYYITGNDRTTYLSSYPECMCVLSDPDNDTSPWGTNTFTNMYFNSGKYVIYGKTTSYLTSVINGGFYFLKSPHVRIYGQDGVEAFLYGGPAYQPVHVHGLTAHHPATVQFRDYFSSMTTHYAFMDTMLEFNHNSNPPNFELVNCNNLRSFKGHDPVQLSGAAYPIESGKYALVGYIFSRLSFDDVSSFNDDPHHLTGVINYELNHTRLFAVRGSIFWNGNTSKWTTRATQQIISNTTAVVLFVDNNTKHMTINGKVYGYNEVYFGSSSVGVDSPWFLNIESVDNSVRLYFWPMHNYSKGIYRTSLPSDYTVLSPIS